ncbi:hypothetical protein BDR03DRAFT_974523, partial [Suillus americanus]
MTKIVSKPAGLLRPHVRRAELTLQRHFKVQRHICKTLQRHQRRHTVAYEIEPRDCSVFA